MDEQMVPGDYTAIVDLIIRSQMDTQSSGNRVGVYSRGLPFTVYEVYPEKDGIVWGRVSSNTGSGTSRFVGLRVTNNLKAHLEKAFSVEPNGDPRKGDDPLANAITLLMKLLRALVTSFRAVDPNQRNYWIGLFFLFLGLTWLASIFTAFAVVGAVMTLESMITSYLAAWINSRNV